jgi:hypothetical protein
MLNEGRRSTFADQHFWCRSPAPRHPGERAVTAIGSAHFLANKR